MLTTKQELAIEYHLQGLDKTNAVFKAFNCKDKASAKVIASKLFKQEKVNNRLTEKQALIDEKTTEMNVDFISLVKKNISPKLIIDKVNELITCGDKRTELSACDMYLKIIGGYKERQSRTIDLLDDKIDNVSEL